MSNLSEIKNIVFQSISLKRIPIVISKIKNRFSYKIQTSKKEKIHKWLENNLSDFSKFAKSLDSLLWDEAIIKSKEIEIIARKKLKNIPFDLGGGGIYPLLYFLTRFTKAEIIVETGVAAGYSSSSFLRAIDKNKFGKLFSSDFPYLRLKNSENYIGILVENRFKKYWNLYIEGDRNNLKKIILEIEKLGKNKIDLFHYDSDKSYLGRKFALDKLNKFISEDTVIVMDDIQDNEFFQNYIFMKNINYWKIFKFNNKYIGLISNQLIK